MYAIYNSNENAIDCSLTIFSNDIANSTTDDNNMGTVIIILIVIGTVLFLFGIYVYFRL